LSHQSLHPSSPTPPSFHPTIRQPSKISARYAPFELPSSDEKVYFFDGKVLANYLVSSANFVHPVSRRPLTREEVLSLDAYLEKHKCGNACVTHVFDRWVDASTDPSTDALFRVGFRLAVVYMYVHVLRVFCRKDSSDTNAHNHVEALRREATGVLEALFAR
jgi:hypothetical protein